MKITSSTELVNRALKEIKTITTDEAYSKMLEAKSNMIDIRDIRELQKEGQSRRCRSHTKRNVRILARS